MVYSNTAVCGENEYGKSSPLSLFTSLKHLKPMDSFGTLQKWKLIFFFINAEFHWVVLTINALLTVRSEMLPISGNNQNIKMFGVPPNTLP